MQWLNQPIPLQPFKTMNFLLRIFTTSGNPQSMQSFSAPVLQEQTRPTNPHLDFTGGFAKWRFDNSKLQRLAN